MPKLPFRKQPGLSEIKLVVTSESVSAGIVCRDLHGGLNGLNPLFCSRPQDFYEASCCHIFQEGAAASQLDFALPLGTGTYFVKVPVEQLKHFAFRPSSMATDGKCRPTSLPRIWEMFGYVLPKKTRERVWEPEYNDMLARYLLSRTMASESQIARRWLTFAFSVRFAWAIVQCYRTVAVSGAVLFCWRCIPEGVKQRVASLLFTMFG